MREKFGMEIKKKQKMEKKRLMKREKKHLHNGRSENRQMKYDEREIIWDIDYFIDHEFVNHRKSFFQVKKIMFQTCVHGKISSSCHICKQKAFVLSMKTLRNEQKLSIFFNNDILKLICSLLTKTEYEFCHRCSAKFPTDEYNDCSTTIKISPLGFVFMTGGYGSIIDNEWVKFIHCDGRTMKFQDFKILYLLKKSRSVPLSNICICKHCTSEMLKNKEIEYCADMYSN